MRSTLLTVATVALLSAYVCADGGFIGARLSDRAEGLSGVSAPGQKGIIIGGGDGTQLLILQTTYRGPSADFAWIIPVPGLPADDGVFPPCPHFIEMAFHLTQTQSQTELAVQSQQSGGMFARGRAGLESLADDVGERVTLHRRISAGEYDAAVLSATDEGALQEWLSTEGYAVAEGARDAFAPYVERAWYFVALSIRPEVIREQPVLADAQPIAIHFPTERLTYPLHISRLSAPAQTSLTLIALAERPVGCEQIGWAELPWERSWPPGTSWARIRREAVEAQRPALVCDAITQIMVPREFSALAEGRWVPDRETDRRLTATRVFTLLAPEEMVDLTFTAEQAPDGAPLVHSSASVRDIFARSPLAILLAGVIFVLVAWVGRGSTPPSASFIRLPVIPAVVLVVWGITGLAGVVLVITMLVLLLGSQREAARFPSPPQVTAMPSRWPMKVAIALIVLSLPVAWLVLFRFDGPWLGMVPGVVATGALLLAALVLIVVQGIRSPGAGSDDSAQSEDREPRRTSLALAGFVATGWAALLIAAGTAEPAPTITAADGALVRLYQPLVDAGLAPALIVSAEIGWVAAAWIFMRAHLRTWPTRAPRLMIYSAAGLSLLYGLAVMMGFAMPGLLDALTSIPLAFLLHAAALVTGIALLCFAVVAPLVDTRSRRAAQNLTAVAAFMALLVLAGQIRLMPHAEAGMSKRPAQAVADRIDAALEEIDVALIAFADDHGAFPAELADLASGVAPQHGLDASGNRVELAEGSTRPYLAGLPIDPITHRSDTWVYEVTGTPMVASGAFTVEVRHDRSTPRDRGLHRWVSIKSMEDAEFSDRIHAALGDR